MGKSRSSCDFLRLHCHMLVALSSSQLAMASVAYSASRWECVLCLRVLKFAVECLFRLRALSCAFLSWAQSHQLTLSPTNYIINVPFGAVSLAFDLEFVLFLSYPHPTPSLSPGPLSTARHSLCIQSSTHISLGARECVFRHKYSYIIRQSSFYVLIARQTEHRTTPNDKIVKHTHTHYWRVWFGNVSRVRTRVCRMCTRACAYKWEKSPRRKRKSSKLRNSKPMVRIIYIMAMPKQTNKCHQPNCEATPNAQQTSKRNEPYDALIWKNAKGDYCMAH